MVMRMQFDYIIVGAGSSGCVLANRLSADPACRVLLLEAGGKGDSFFVSMPAGFGKTANEPGHSWHYFSAPEPGLGHRPMLLPRGKGLGGSSNINGLLYVRGQADDYDTWSQLGATGWGWADVLPYFRRSEAHLGEAGPLHGRDGELAVSETQFRDTTNAAVIKGFGQIGVPHNADFNGSAQFGAGHYQMTMRAGRRCSAADAFLRPVMNRPNLTVLTGVSVQRVLIENGAATGAVFLQGGETRTALAAREVILSAGAYHSPKLLMLSGIGPAADLQAAGISPVVDRGAVGANLQDHYVVPMSWELRPGVFSFNRELGGLRLVWNVLRYLAQRDGPMTIPAAQTGAFVKSDPALDRPDIQFHCLPVSGDIKAAAEGAKGKLSAFPGLTLAPCMLRPESRGRVRLAGPDPEAVPDIVHNYLVAAEDCRLTLRGMALARDLAASPALASLILREDAPGAEADNEEALLDYARRLGSTGYHPVGTCRMGSDDDAVVDPQLRVRGVERLRVIDASVMPRLVSGNTNAAAIMIGEKGADLILKGAAQ